MTELNALMRRLERAQAQFNERLNAAAGGRSLAVGGGFAHWRGPAHPLNQALGLIDPITEPELDAVEQFLGSPTVLELSPGADPALWKQLATRGYRVHQFQQLWARELRTSEPVSADVRLARVDEVDDFARLVGAGFAEQQLALVLDSLHHAPRGPRRVRLHRRAGRRARGRRNPRRGGRCRAARR